MEKTVRRCTFCANQCPLTQPRCDRGRVQAEEGGLYEEKKKQNRIRQWLELHGSAKKYRF